MVEARLNFVLERPRKVYAGNAVARRVWRAGKPATFTPGQREVVVRITRRTRSPQALKAQFLYVTRGGVLAGELPSGQLVREREALAQLRDRWVEENAALARRGSCPTQSLGVVLSMPAGTPLEAVTAAARGWARQHLSPVTDWLAVPHADRDHPHVHVTVRAVQDDGYRLRASPSDVQEWRVTFADNLRALGIMADATPRHQKLERLQQERVEQRIEHPAAPELRLAL